MALPAKVLLPRFQKAFEGTLFIPGTQSRAFNRMRGEADYMQRVESPSRSTAHAHLGRAWAFENLLEQRAVRLGKEGHGATVRLGARRAAHAVQVRRERLRCVEVDHRLHAGDVQPARRHVGSDEERNLLLPKRLQRRQPLRLCQVAVQLRRLRQASRARAAARRVRVGAVCEGAHASVGNTTPNNAAIYDGFVSSARLQL